MSTITADDGRDGISSGSIVSRSFGKYPQCWAAATIRLRDVPSGIPFVLFVLQCGNNRPHGRTLDEKQDIITRWPSHWRTRSSNLSLTPPSDPEVPCSNTLVESHTKAAMPSCPIFFNLSWSIHGPIMGLDRASNRQYGKYYRPWFVSKWRWAQHRVGQGNKFNTKAAHINAGIQGNLCHCTFASPTSFNLCRAIYAVKRRGINRAL